MRDGIEVVERLAEEGLAQRIVDAIGPGCRTAGSDFGKMVDRNVGPVVEGRRIAELDARFPRLEGLIPLETGLLTSMCITVPQAARLKTGLPRRRQDPPRLALRAAQKGATGHGAVEVGRATRRA